MRSFVRWKSIDDVWRSGFIVDALETIRMAPRPDQIAVHAKNGIVFVAKAGAELCDHMPTDEIMRMFMA